MTKAQGLFWMSTVFLVMAMAMICTPYLFADLYSGAQKECSLTLGAIFVAMGLLVRSRVK